MNIIHIYHYQFRISLNSLRIGLIDYSAPIVTESSLFLLAQQKMVTVVRILGKASMTQLQDMVSPKAELLHLR